MHASAAARAALLSGVAAALLVGLGGSIGPAAASTPAPHRGPVTVHTLQHGMCHMAGDSADSLY